MRVWDTRPWTPELKAEQQAVSLIRFLFDKGLSKEDVLQSLAVGATINDLVRHRATEWAGPYADNLERSQRWSWSPAFRRRFLRLKPVLQLLGGAK